MAVQHPDAPMRSRTKRQPRVEYWVYFILLFALILPVTLIKRVFALLTGASSDESILHEAKSEAHTASSMIFSV